MRCFLSHNKADKPIARKIGAHLTLAGLDPWFDEWEIQAGDSIPGKLNEALLAFDAFILVWSANAAKSKWVSQELETAIMHAINNQTSKIVPCMLDNTRLPPLIANRSGIDFADHRKGIDALLEGLTGNRTRKSRLMAIQSAIYDLDVKWITHPAVIPILCCPKCGSEEATESWQQSDRRGDNYAGLQCTACGWSEGGEI